MLERTLLWVGLALLAGCTEEHASLGALLGRPGNTLSITPTAREVVFTLQRDDEGGRCPVLSKDVELTVDGKSPASFDRGGNLGSAFSRKCQPIAGAVIELATLERGEDRTLVLREGTQTVTAVLRLVALPGAVTPWGLVRCEGASCRLTPRSTP